MSKTFAETQGLFVAQALLKSIGHDIKVDGRWGPQSKSAYVMTNTDSRKRIVDVVEQVSPAAASMVSIPASAPAKQSDFDQVVQAIVAEAKVRGLSNPEHYIAQIALESGWGRSTPRSASGGKSWNYGGIKASSLPERSEGSVSVSTKEYESGVQKSTQDRFAVFKGPEDFARMYFKYIFDGGSAYRYKGVEKAENGYQFGAILQKNGYATDPNYAGKIASMVNSVNRRYSDVIA